MRASVHTGGGCCWRVRLATRGQAVLSHNLYGGRALQPTEGRTTGGAPRRRHPWKELVSSIELGPRRAIPMSVAAPGAFRQLMNGRPARPD